MEKAYKIFDIRFDNVYLIVTIDNEIFTFKLKEISKKMSNATEQERNDFKISPSGYGIHWRLLDEDLSINGLLKSAKVKQNFLHQI